MFKKFTKILGVGLTAILLATLVIGTAAVPAAGANAAWSALSIPGVAGNVILASDVGKMVTSPDGSTIFVADGATLYRSTNGGVSWSVVGTGLTGAITAIALSPGYTADSRVFVSAGAGGNVIYQSGDAGAIFVQVAAAITGEVITSIALSPNYPNDNLMVVGTTDAVGGTFGDVYLMGQLGFFGPQPMGLNEDITAVAFSPNYPGDRTILAVGSNGTQTRLHNSVNGVWDTSWGAAIISAAPDVGAAGAIISSSIALATDYNGMDITKRIAYVATVSGAADGIWRVSSAAATAISANVVASLAHSGPVATGILYAGAQATNTLWRCANPTAAAPLFVPATRAPSGSGPTQVAAAPTKIYAGTAGAESAFSVSDDGGINFYQTGLIHTVINAILDVTPSPAYATDTTIFMMTSTTGQAEHLWKTVDGGTSWARIMAFATTNQTAIVRLSPAYATDQTLFVAETGAGTTAIMKSITGGASWLANMVSISNIADLLVGDPNTIYVADFAGTKVQKNIMGAWHWGAGTCTGATTLSSLAMTSNGDILVGTANGMVFRSIDGGLTYAKLGATVTGGGMMVIAPDPNYATNGLVYTGDSSGTAAGIYRLDTTTAIATTAWTQIDGGLVPAGSCTGIVLGADGTLYAADRTAAAVGPPVVGGIVRSLDPTTPAPGAPTFEVVSAAAGDALTAGATLANIKLAVGSTILLVIDSTGVKVFTYTDTLTGAVTLTYPEWFIYEATGEEYIGDALSSSAAMLYWTAVTGATQYTVSYGATATASTTTTTSTTASKYIGGLTGGATLYYWKVRVSAPVIGAWSPIWKFKTLLVAPVAPGTPWFPALGSTGISITPTLTWPAVAGATGGYAIELSETDDFSILEWSHTTDTTITFYAITEAEALSYSTIHFWRVRALTGDPQRPGPYQAYYPLPGSPWATGSFTTMAEPPAPTPPVVIEPTPPTEVQVEVIEIEVPVPIPGAPQAIPDYLLWTVIGIGGVLVIALIVLIVQTRRAR